ncbi:acyltransferase family protein [Erwinia sp. MMLR14_017]|uniref:acyltransferase family protein n=1 Tax=Erwinia sp. MMLR14_017 TaxID=3093842 RepID=UPI00298FBEF3|nr:acyltransferase family protein [Erwinia sp. MMLR14_017]MDW8845869.1 acyltransferase family protein [Erwinia sp. MMLR14_017]
MSQIHAFSYRKDIDGLRALAILLVVLFHSGVAELSGGFIGVDVFFVISGFLIGSIISREIGNNTFTFQQFYVRRIRRIAPALFFMLFCITALSYSILSPLEFRDLAKYITSVLLFVPNVMLLKGIDYFNPNADLNPMLMTWSLGIEEQFYFVLPALMILAHKLRFSPKAVITVLSLASLAAGIFITPINGNSAFYLLHTRAWELGAGVLLALWRSQPLTGGRSLPLAVAGLLLILIPVFLLDKESAFPGYLALLPVAGAVLLILTHTPLHQRLLENRVMVFIGKVSYSWYLWHWPLLSLARISADAPLTAIQGLAISAGALVIATLSWYFVEKPFRRPAQPKQRIITSYTILCVVGIFSFVSIYMAGGLKYRVDDLVNNGELFKVEAEKNPCLMTYGENLPSSNSLCMPKMAVPAVALIGDSHAAALRAAVAQYALRKQKPMFELTKSSCPFLVGVSRYMVEHPQQGEQCTAFNKEVMKTLLSDKVDEVIITAFWSSGFSLVPGYGYRSVDGKVTDNYLALNAGMSNVVKELLAANKKVALIEDAPSLDIDPLRFNNTQHIPLRKKINAWLSDSSQTVADRTLRFHLTEDKVNTILASFAQPGVKVIRLRDNLCSQQGCLIASKGLPLYYDKHHLTDLGSTIALGNNL